MKAVEKALWYIESHYRDSISLDTLATVAGVSRYHLSRIFCYSVGQPISRYLRLRRLSNAAIALAAGAPDILEVALDNGYGSHEAFTRAFKQQFDRTPEQVREQGHTDGLALTEVRHMPQARKPLAAEPRLERLGELTIVGLSRHYPFEKVPEIPDQWQHFAPQIPRIASADPATYGVIYNNTDASFDYLSGVALAAQASAPGNMVQIRLAPQRYAVFRHEGHVAGLRQTCEAIWADWLPASDSAPVEAPWFERYGDGFNPQTGEGGLEVWIPIRA